jgi:hypothetical protein
VLPELVLLAGLAVLVLQVVSAQDLSFITVVGAVALAVVDLPVLVGSGAVALEEQPEALLGQRTRAGAVVELSQTTLPQQEVAESLSFAQYPRTPTPELLLRVEPKLRTRVMVLTV